jgi:hypothetical protein
LEKRSTIISASIPKYVDGIYGCTTQAFPGAQLVSSGRINLSSVDFIIIQIGTNNISNGDSI